MVWAGAAPASVVGGARLTSELGSGSVGVQAIRHSPMSNATIGIGNFNKEYI